jgi:hypothetical protein
VGLVTPYEDPDRLDLECGSVEVEEVWLAPVRSLEADRSADEDAKPGVVGILYCELTEARLLSSSSWPPRPGEEIGSPSISLVYQGSAVYNRAVRPAVLKCNNKNHDLLP